MKLYKQNEQNQSIQATSYLNKAYRALKQAKSALSPIELIVDKYQVDNKPVTALLLPVKESDKDSDNLAGKLYAHCLKAFEKVAGEVNEEKFGNYVALRADKDVQGLESLAKVRKPLSRKLKLAVTDNFCFDYAVPSNESDKEKIVKLSRAVSLDKLYSMFPQVPQGSLRAIYALTKMGAYDKQEKLSDDVRAEIAKYVKKGKNYRWIADKLKVNPFQVIAYRAVLTRQGGKK